MRERISSEFVKTCYTVKERAATWIFRLVRKIVYCYKYMSFMTASPTFGIVVRIAVQKQCKQPVVNYGMQ